MPTRRRHFVSKAQWRFAFSKGAPAGLRRAAHRMARRTPGGKGRRFRRLPARKGARKR